MVALKKLALYSIIALLTVLLFGCGDPAADQEEVEEEELQEEVEENGEEEEENDQEKDDNGNGENNGSSGSGTSGSSFSHTVEMDIDGEVKEGEGEEWWKDEEGESNDEWWDD